MHPENFRHGIWYPCQLVAKPVAWSIMIQTTAGMALSAMVGMATLVAQTFQIWSHVMSNICQTHLATDTILMFFM